MGREFVGADANEVIGEGAVELDVADGGFVGIGMRPDEGNGRRCFGGESEGQEQRKGGQDERVGLLGVPSPSSYRTRMLVRVGQGRNKKVLQLFFGEEVFGGDGAEDFFGAGDAVGDFEECGVAEFEHFVFDGAEADFAGGAIFGDEVAEGA